MSAKIKEFTKKYSDKIIAVIAVIILYGAFVIFVGCPIKVATGVSCAGCGMTRALWSAVTFHFDKAFYYHPLWVLVPPWIVILIFKSKINKNVFRVLLGITIAAFIIVYFIRMFDPHNHVVVFEPKNSIVGRIMK